MDDVCSLASAQILKIRTMEILLARKNHIAQNQSKTIKNKKRAKMKMKNMRSTPKLNFSSATRRTYIEQ